MGSRVVEQLSRSGNLVVEPGIASECSGFDAVRGLAERCFLGNVWRLHLSFR